MEFVADEAQKVKGLSFAREFSLAFRYPILLKPGVDDASPVDHEELHEDGIATFEHRFPRVLSLPSIVSKGARQNQT